MLTFVFVVAIFTSVVITFLVAYFAYSFVIIWKQSNKLALLLIIGLELIFVPSVHFVAHWDYSTSFMCLTWLNALGIQLAKIYFSGASRNVLIRLLFDVFLIAIMLQYFIPTATLFTDFVLLIAGGMFYHFNFLLFKEECNKT